MASLDTVLENVLSGSGARNPSEVLILALHSSLLVEGFVCVALGDNMREEQQQQPISMLESPYLPPEWNMSSDVYTLQYRHERTGLICLVKAIPVDGDLLINAMASLIPGTVYTVSLMTSMYVRDRPGVQLNSPSVFQNLLQLMALLNKEIILKLQGGMASSSSSRHSQKDVQEKKEDPLRVHPIMSGSVGVHGHGSQGPYGYGDLDRFPTSGDSQLPFREGGMVFDPMRQGRGMFAPGIHPPPWVPPGARFDPIHPLDPYGPHPGRPRPQRPGYDPNPDHMHPPGFGDNMFS